MDTLDEFHSSRICHVALGRSTPRTEFSDSFGLELHIPWLLIQRGLRGVAIATKADSDEVEHIERAITIAAIGEEHNSLHSERRALVDLTTDLPLRGWHEFIKNISLSQAQRQRLSLAIALAFLCHSGRQGFAVCTADLDFVWTLVRDALQCPSIPYMVSRSAQGFLFVPLWSITKDGNIEELFRLHVWLPDRQRGVPDLAVHSHQAFAQSWIITGQGRNHNFKVEKADSITATHAEFEIAWSGSDGKTATSPTSRTRSRQL